MFRTMYFLLKKIKCYDFHMIPIIVLYTVLFSLYPFIWVVVPSAVISAAAAGDLSRILSYVLIGGVTAILSVIGTGFARGNYRMRMNNVRYHLIRDLMEYSLTMPYDNTLDPKALTEIELANRSITSPMTGAGGIILAMLTLFGNLLASLGLLGLIFSLSWWLAIILFIIVGLTFYFKSLAARFEEDKWSEMGDLSRKHYRTTDILTNPEYGKDIRIYSLSGLLEHYCIDIITRLRVLFSAISTMVFKADTATAVLGIVRDVGVFSYVTYLLLEGTLDVSQFFLYTSGVTAFVVSLQESMTQIALIKKESNRFSSFMRLMEKESSIGAKIREGDFSFLKGAVAIELSNVTFRYPNADKDTLSNLSLSISAGEKLALVGENGAGKSTLIKLLCRLYQPQEGSITINGVPIHTIPEDIYWKALGVVFQDAMIFPFSIKENVALSETIDVNKMEHATVESGLKDITDTFLLGMDTILLRTLDDNGLEVSGGQKQKLYLARALYKGSSFLMLDEPTAALDPLAEAALYESYHLLSKEKTSLYISHRLASTKFCDRIAYIEGGAITELGTHQELMNLKGAYCALFETQSKYYKEVVL